MRRIILLEDDHRQVDSSREKIVSVFPQLSVEIVNSEYEFRQQLESIATQPPDVIVIDVMLRWTDPAPQMPLRPPDVQREGFYTAGLRCAKLLQHDPRTRRIPLIFYTLVPADEVKEKVLTDDELRKTDPIIINKSGDAQKLIM